MQNLHFMLSIAEPSQSNLSTSPTATVWIGTNISRDRIFLHSKTWDKTFSVLKWVSRYNGDAFFFVLIWLDTWPFMAQYDWAQDHLLSCLTKNMTFSGPIWPEARSFLDKMTWDGVIYVPTLIGKGSFLTQYDSGHYKFFTNQSRHPLSNKRWWNWGGGEVGGEQKKEPSLNVWQDVAIRLAMMTQSAWQGGQKL